MVMERPVDFSLHCVKSVIHRDWWFCAINCAQKSSRPPLVLIKWWKRKAAFSPERLHTNKSWNPLMFSPPQCSNGTITLKRSRDETNDWSLPSLMDAPPPIILMQISRGWISQSWSDLMIFFKMPILSFSPTTQNNLQMILPGHEIFKNNFLLSLLLKISDFILTRIYEDHQIPLHRRKPDLM